MRHGSLGLVLLLGVLAGCDSGPKGTYTNVNGLITLDLVGGGKATLSAFGETKDCTYTTADKALHVTCGREKFDFRVNSDGSLVGPGTLGVMKKSK
jgi:hypothetical protein